MSKTFGIILLTLTLSACGTIKVFDDGNGMKRIERRGAAILSTSPEAAYAHKETQTDMKITAFKNCPSGYNLIKEQYVPETPESKDKLVWYIKCS